MVVRDCYEKSLVVYISNLDISEKKRNTGRNRRLFLFQMQDSVQSKKLFNLISQNFSTKTHFKWGICHQKKTTAKPPGDYLRPWACSVHGSLAWRASDSVNIYQTFCAFCNKKNINSYQSESLSALIFVMNRIFSLDKRGRYVPRYQNVSFVLHKFSWSCVKTCLMCLRLKPWARICLKTSLRIHFINCKLIFAFISGSIMDTRIMFKPFDLFNIISKVSNAGKTRASRLEVNRTKFLNNVLRRYNEIHQYRCNIYDGFCHTYA